MLSRLSRKATFLSPATGCGNHPPKGATPAPRLLGRSKYWIKSFCVEPRPFCLYLPDSSPCNQALASLHSRFTVRGEMRSASAVSSTDSPPKKRISTIRACRGSSSSKLRRASSNCTISRDFLGENSRISSRGSFSTRPPRFPAWWPRAWSTRICRINLAAMPKKCARSCQSVFSWADQPQVGLIRQGRCLKSVIGTSCRM